MAISVLEDNSKLGVQPVQDRPVELPRASSIYESAFITGKGQGLIAARHSARQPNPVRKAHLRRSSERI